MASFSATGHLHEIFDEQQISERFTKREFVLEIPGQYPEQIKFQLVQDKTALVDPYQIGDEVEVSFNLRGKGFSKNGQMAYFTNLEAWRLTPVGAATSAQPAARASQPTRAAAAQPIPDDHDLPF
jgi:single-strand DNA-binding protein